jgi:CRP-like cAMP-binding protein
MRLLLRIKRFFRRFRSRRMPGPHEIFEMVSGTPLLRDVPEGNLREMLRFAEPIRVREGDVVIREGEEGDNYYLILDGMASVLRRPSPAEEPRVAAVFAPGFAFGEEALISYARRNATVVMETDGILLKIPKNAFLDYIVSSLVTFVTPGEAQQHILQGARWLDTRPRHEAVRSLLPGALCLPLDELRERLKEFDPSVLYVCYCDTGRLSATAAFLMRLAGYKAVVLQGGLRLLDRRFKSGV